MHVSLTDKLDEYVKNRVQSGLYNNASEVVREALRLKISSDETDEIKLQRLRDAIEPAWQQAERGEFAEYDLKSILAELDQEATAKRIAFRVCELLLGEGVADADAINELARALRGVDLDVGWCVETVLRSQLFYSSSNIGNRVLGPFEYLIGAVRSLEMFDPPPSTLLLAEWASRLGQNLFYPPNVFGWPGGRAWMSSRALIGRVNFATALARGRVHNPLHPFDESALAKSHGVKGNELAEFYGELLLGQAAASNQSAQDILASPAAQLG